MCFAKFDVVYNVDRGLKYLFYLQFYLQTKHRFPISIVAVSTDNMRRFCGSCLAGDTSPASPRFPPNRTRPTRASAEARHDVTPLTGHESESGMRHVEFRVRPDRPFPLDTSCRWHPSSWLSKPMDSSADGTSYLSLSRPQRCFLGACVPRFRHLPMEYTESCFFGP